MSDDVDREPVVQAGEEPRSPEEIRATIEETREQLGDTVEALAAKTDVKARARDRFTATKENVGQIKDDVVTKARQATPESAEAGIAQASAKVKEQPLPFAALAAFTAGVLVGWLVGRG